MIIDNSVQNFTKRIIFKEQNTAYSLSTAYLQPIYSLFTATTTATLNPTTAAALNATTAATAATLRMDGEREEAPDYRMIDAEDVNKKSIFGSNDVNYNPRVAVTTATMTTITTTLPTTAAFSGEEPLVRRWKGLFPLGEYKNAVHVREVTRCPPAVVNTPAITLFRPAASRRHDAAV